MVAIKGHFDGKVFVPDEPVDLTPNQRVVIHVEPVKDTAEEGAPEDQANTGAPQSLLDWIVANPVDDPSLPTDLAHQHDHYLYGTPKKP